MTGVATSAEPLNRILINQDPPKGLSIESSWPLIVGIWDTLEGSCGGVQEWFRVYGVGIMLFRETLSCKH